MAARRGSARWARVRRAAFERDRASGARCWICGGEIDYSLGPSGRDGPDMAWEPDHYLPVSRHPEFEYELTNIRAAHCKCNRSRGSRAGVRQLGRPTRDW